VNSADRLGAVLTVIPHRIVACSGGVDSMLLATLAHRASPESTLVVHDVTPAVPAAATARVIAHADDHGWRLRTVSSTEFEDERYLSNPRNRCYFCKSHLYDAMSGVAARLPEDAAGWTVLSGANTDDLGEYRPGLDAAAERGVRHPYLEAQLSKNDIRELARAAGLDFADLAASPCLASRLYTGTAVTPRRLRAVEVGEELLRTLTGIDVARCRVREQGTDVRVIVEVGAEDWILVTATVLARVAAAMRSVEPTVSGVELDDLPYRPGRALTVLA
jgi:uncharacterized protein